jgi:hypothetical protein
MTGQQKLIPKFKELLGKEEEPDQFGEGAEKTQSGFNTDQIKLLPVSTHIGTY